MGNRVVVGVCAFVCASAVPGGARADECRELGGIGVAIGAMVGGGVVLVTSLIGPAVVVENDSSLEYWDGFGWSMLAGALGVGAGTLIAATVACEQGEWLPAALGFGGSLASLLIWSSSGDEGASAALGGPAMGLSLGVSPSLDGVGLGFGGRF